MICPADFTFERLIKEYYFALKSPTSPESSLTVSYGLLYTTSIVYCIKLDSVPQMSESERHNIIMNKEKWRNGISLLFACI